MQKNTYDLNRNQPDRISDAQVMEYAARYMKRFKEGISSEEARMQIRRLLMLYKVLLEQHEREVR